MIEDELLRVERDAVDELAYDAKDFRAQLALTGRDVVDVRDTLQQSRDVRDYQFALWALQGPQDKTLNGQFLIDRYFGEKVHLGRDGQRALLGEQRTAYTTREILDNAVEQYVEHNKDQANALVLAYLQHLQAHTRSSVDLVGDGTVIKPTDVGEPKYASAALADSSESLFKHVKPESPEEARQLVDLAVEALCSRRVYEYLNYFELLHTIDAGYAQQALMRKLNAPELQRYDLRFILLEALAYLGSEAKPIVDGKAQLFGGEVELREVPKAAVSVERLSVHGYFGALDAEGGVTGIFNLLDAVTTPDGLTALVRELKLDDLFFADVEGDIRSTDKAAVLTLFQQEYAKWKQHPLLVENHLSIDLLTLKEQAILFYALRTDQLQEVAPYLKPHRIFPLRAALLDIGYTGSTKHFKAVWEASPYMTTDEAGDARNSERYFLQIEPHAANPIHWIVNFYEQANRAARVMHAQLEEAKLGSSLSVDDIARALVSGAYQLLSVEAPKQPSMMVRTLTLRPFVGHGNGWVGEMRKYTDNMKVGLALVKDITEAGASLASIDLAHYERRQQALVELLKQSDVAPVITELLTRSGKLKPIPEIHWRVDRTSSEYIPRLGLDVNALITSPDQYVVELGPGSGQAKAERQAIVGAHEFAIADALYYSVEQYVYNVLDFDEELSSAERRVIAEIIYKAIYLQEGTEESDDLTYAQDRLTQLTKDPASITELIREQLPRIAELKMVPATISSRKPDGTVYYPNKIKVAEQTHAVQSALQSLRVRQDNPLHRLPIHPEGVVVGDLSVVERLAAQSVDVMIGVRSTVYKRGADWVLLGKAIAKALKNGGVWVDDSLRDNDGYRYRLEELADLKKELQGQHIALGIVSGPGFTGEDKDPIVPLALVMTKGSSVQERVGDLIQSGYRLTEA